MSDEQEKITRLITVIRAQQKTGKSNQEIIHELVQAGFRDETAVKLMEMADTMSGNPNAHSFAGLEKQERKRKGRRNILFGSLWVAAGSIVTLATMSAAGGGGHYVVAYGAIIGGLIQLIIGIVQVI